MASHFLLLGVPLLAPHRPHSPHFLISFPLSLPRLSLITAFCLYPTHRRFSPSVVLSFPLKPIFSYSLSLPFSFLLRDSFSFPSAPLRPLLTPPPPPVSPPRARTVCSRFLLGRDMCLSASGPSGRSASLAALFTNLFFSFRGVVCRAQAASLFSRTAARPTT